MIKKSVALAAFFASSLIFAAGNPAYEYCLGNDGKIETRRDQVGNEYGVCMFISENGINSECGQWAFFRGECQKNQCANWAVEEDKCVEFLP